jgi:hypothetical protein
VQAHVLIGRPFREQDGSCVFATFVERSHTAQTSTSVRPRDGGSTLPNDRARSGGNVAETRLRSLCSAATFMGYAMACNGYTAKAESGHYQLAQLLDRVCDRIRVGFSFPDHLLATTYFLEAVPLATYGNRPWCFVPFEHDR